MNNSPNLQLVESVLQQLSEMQREIENVTATNTNLNSQLDEQNVKIDGLEKRLEEYQQAMTRTSADADEQCRKMQLQMQDAKTEAAEIQARLETERREWSDRVHHRNMVIALLIVYASIITFIVTGGAG